MNDLNPFRAKKKFSFYFYRRYFLSKSSLLPELIICFHLFEHFSQINGRYFLLTLLDDFEGVRAHFFGGQCTFWDTKASLFGIEGNLFAKFWRNLLIATLIHRHHNYFVLITFQPSILIHQGSCCGDTIDQLVKIQKIVYTWKFTTFFSVSKSPQSQWN